MQKLLGAACAAILVASAIPQAQSQQAVPVSDNESTELWFVELASAPAVEGTATATLEREEADFHETATGAGIRYDERRHFRKLWNGLSIRATAREISKIRALPGVQAVYPVVKAHALQQEGAPDAVADLITAVKMTGADVAQNDLGLTGRGVRVAVMDTGVDFDHPDLGARSDSGRLQRPRHARRRDRRREWGPEGRRAGCDVPRVSRLRLRRIDDLRPDARRDGDGPR